MSHFDFEANDVAQIITRVATVATTVEIETRLHHPEEPTDLHPRRSAPSFRISMKLRPGDGIIKALAAVETDLGIALVLDRDGTVRLSHSPSSGQFGG